MHERPRQGSATSSGGEDARDFRRGLARAFGGAIIFALPLFMTMEMWWLGFYVDRFRIALFMLLMIPLLVGISRYSGFRVTQRLRDDVVDAFVAYGVGFVASVVILVLLNLIDFRMPLSEIVGKISLQAIPASFGAMIANSQLKSEEQEEQQEKRVGYSMELILMAAGAVFLAFNLAPTEEIIIVAFVMTAWHAILLMVVSLALMHAFVYSVGFKGQHELPEGAAWGSMFLLFTVVGYAISLAISAYVLWTFGRFENTDFAMRVMMTIVLGFPASIGASAARLIL